MTFNGKVLEDARIEHADLMAGGDLVFYVSNKKSHPGTKTVPHWDQNSPTLGLNRPLRENSLSVTPSLRGNISFTLNRQHRIWPLTFGWAGDTLTVTCKEATYRIPKSVVENGARFCWDIPADGAVYQPQGTFGFISRKAMRDLQERLRAGEPCSGMGERTLVRADIDRTEMVIAYAKEPDLYLVVEMRHNPLGIDWQIAADSTF